MAEYSIGRALLRPPDFFTTASFPAQPLPEEIARPPPAARLSAGTAPLHTARAKAPEGDSDPPGPIMRLSQQVPAKEFVVQYRKCTDTPCALSRKIRRVHLRILPNLSKT
jgi:hypothetical protein